MKIKLYVHGKYKGIREVDEDSITGLALRGDFLGSIKKVQKAQDELNKLGEDGHEHEWMPNGRCAWCGEHFRGD